MAGRQSIVIIGAGGHGGELRSYVGELIADGAPLVARWHKQFARRLGNPAPITDIENDACFDCFDTEDFRIGYAAFLAKQPPIFSGR